MDVALITGGRMAARFLMCNYNQVKFIIEKTIKLNERVLPLNTLWCIIKHNDFGTGDRIS